MGILKDELNRLGIAVGGGTGAICVDLAAYLSHPCGLALGASLSEKPYAKGNVCDLGSMSVLNQRYTNKNWITMTGKVGRKLCWYGCVAALPLNEISRIGYLNVGYGVEDGPMSWHCVPVSFDKGLLSDDRSCISFSVCLALSNPGRPGFDIVWREKMPDYGRDEHGWYYGKPTVRNHGGFAALTPVVDQGGTSDWTLYGGGVKLAPYTPEDTLV